MELFYDLVFVFAVSQLSHHLLEHLTWRGAAETVVLLAGVFGTWAYTSLVATLLDIERDITRWMVLIVMGLGLYMNAAIPGAFEDRAWAFVVPLLVTLFFVAGVTAAAGRTEALREHFRRTLVWMVVAAPLWIVGACVESESRLWWWATVSWASTRTTWWSGCGCSSSSCWARPC